MSYDLRVWGRKMSEVGDLLSAARGWVGRDGLWVLEGRSWQIAVCPPQAVEPEDVPGAAELLPGLSSLVELSLEPISAPKAALLALTSAARSLAEELAGVIDDPQEGTLSLPRGAKRYEKPKREERFTVLDLSWWYAPSPVRSDDGPRTLLAILTKHLPESVPRRYGLWEPPQYKTAETGLAGLESFIAQNLDNSPVFYTTRPVVGFSIADCNATAHPRLGFRAKGIGPIRWFSLPLRLVKVNGIPLMRHSPAATAIAGAMALLLAVVGIYGVVSYAVSQRTREVGIRLALGAPLGGVQQMFVRRALLLVTIGSAIGLVGAAGVTRLMSSLLFGVSALDPVTYASVAVVIGVAALVAASLPARRATRTNPLDALRAE